MYAVLTVRRHGAAKCRFRATPTATADRSIDAADAGSMLAPIVPKRL
jgi:hypothetical protein